MERALVLSLRHEIQLVFQESFCKEESLNSAGIRMSRRDEGRGGDLFWKALGRSAKTRGQNEPVVYAANPLRISNAYDAVKRQ